MKKVLCYVITATLLLSSSSVAFAKQNTNAGQSKKQATEQKKETKKAETNKAEAKKAETNKAEAKKAETKKAETQKAESKTDTKKAESKADTKKAESKADTKKAESSKSSETKKNDRVKEKKQSFKISGSPAIKYGKYKLPIRPITKGMGATLDFNKETAVLTVTKGTTTIVINFKEKTVMVNGLADMNSGIFTAKNDKKTKVLIKYIANKLGVRINIKGDDVTTEIPGLDLPTNVKVTPVGETVVANTLNSTTQYLTATADIIAGQAVGGKAELYVGSKLVATSAAIVVSDTIVTFTTSDGTPTNEELKALISEGGKVTVKLYNAGGQSVTSSVNNPTLRVDYVAPVVIGFTSAQYTVSGSAIIINVTDASSLNDKVDVTKISLYDAALNKTYHLTNAEITGSVGVVSSATTLTITLGTTDIQGLAGFGGSTVSLNIAPGSLVMDKSGNISAEITGVQNLPVSITN